MTITPTITDPIRPILTLLQHRDRMVRAAMLEQLLADGLHLTAPERLAIFDSPDWHVAYPDLDIAISAFYSPAALDYPFTLPEPEPRIWHVCEDPQPVCQVPHMTSKPWPAWFWVTCGVVGTLIGVAIATR